VLTKFLLREIAVRIPSDGRSHLVRMDSAVALWTERNEVVKFVASASTYWHDMMRLEWR
jgi:hypothetical protein